MQGLDWVWKMLELTLQPGMDPAKGMPTVLCYDELEQLDPTVWLGIQNLIIANDR